MKRKLLHTPEGVRDIYNMECARKLILQENLQKLLKKYGYHAIETPTFEFFDIFSRELNKALETLGIRPVWWNTGAAMKEPAEIDRLIEPYLGGDDPIFGFRTPLRLEEFFDREKLDRIRPDDAARMNILIGIGASLAGWDGLLLYIDIPKN